MIISRSIVLKAPKQERRDKLIVSSTARGAAKNVIKVDVLLIEPVTIEIPQIDYPAALIS